jgi:thymidylate kinase
MNNKSSLLITLCGLDGSGKTTQSTMLMDYFKKNQIKSKYVWLRAPERLTLPISLFFKSIGISKGLVTDSGKRKGVTDLSNHITLQKIWKFFLLLDLKFVSSYKIFSELKKNDILIVDRYVIDTLVDLVIDTKDESVIDSIGSKFLKLIPKNSKIFFLDVNPQVSFDRNHEENLEILEFRRKLYLKISKICNMIVIDSSKSIDDIHNEILKNCNMNNTKN